jgi:hypothetical protein
MHLWPRIAQKGLTTKIAVTLELECLQCHIFPPNVGHCFFRTELSQFSGLTAHAPRFWCIIPLTLRVIGALLVDHSGIWTSWGARIKWLAWHIAVRSQGLKSVCPELISIRYLIFQLSLLHLRYLKLPPHLQKFSEAPVTRRLHSSTKPYACAFSEAEDRARKALTTIDRLKPHLRKVHGPFLGFEECNS